MDGVEDAREVERSDLADRVAAHKRGNPVGLYSICSAHPTVLEIAVRQALENGSPLLAESTCNQVNQEGGYTGMVPAQFRDLVCHLSDRHGLPVKRIILGGDHLGPGPWQHDTAETAMAKARVLVRDCVLAGYTKIHLDASVRCATDPAGLPLDRSVSARRTAELCAAAEEAGRSAQVEPALRYVIGTEVPTPGGASAGQEHLRVTSVEDAREAIDETEKAFRRFGLQSAWERVVALVVQPGVEFGTDSVHEYRRQDASRLSRFIERNPQLVYEAHSTDYQAAEALRALVEDHFAILKVGPALTFAFREVVFGLAAIEGEWHPMSKATEPSGIRHALQAAMLAQPAYWDGYYRGSEAETRFARDFGYSDRVRYYWPVPAVQQALARLFATFESAPPPLSLVSQFFPRQYGRIRAGELRNCPQDLMRDAIGSVLAGYASACGFAAPQGT